MPKRASNPLGPALELDRGGGEPLHRQIYFAIRQAILNGALRPGARLPATRALARDLAVSRNTVMAAFEQLHAEGYVDGRVGAGSFVSRELPAAVLGARGSARPAAGAAQPRPGPSARGATLIALRSGRSRPQPFSPGVPELEQFPFDDWARLLGAALAAAAARLPGRRRPGRLPAAVRGDRRLSGAARGRCRAAPSR